MRNSFAHLHHALPDFVTLRGENTRAKQGCSPCGVPILIPPARIVVVLKFPVRWGYFSERVLTM
jgi:hypothetical protein